MVHDLQSLAGGDQMEFEDIEERISKSDEGLEYEFFSDKEIIAITSKDECEDKG